MNKYYIAADKYGHVKAGAVVVADKPKTTLTVKRANIAEDILIEVTPDSDYTGYDNIDGDSFNITINYIDPNDPEGAHIEVSTGNIAVGTVTGRKFIQIINEQIGYMLEFSDINGVLYATRSYLPGEIVSIAMLIF